MARKPPQPKAAPRATALWVPIDSVKLDPHNVREHTPRNLDVVRKSLDRFGQRKPVVVDADGIIRAGNGTWECAKLLGWSEIWIAPSTLRGAEAEAYAVADNRSGDLSQFDELELVLQIERLGGDAALLDVIGFDAAEVEGMLPTATPQDGAAPVASKSRTGPKIAGRIVIRLMIATPSVELIERALLATGAVNREIALNMVARGFLEHKGMLE